MVGQAEGLHTKWDMEVSEQGGRVCGRATGLLGHTDLQGGSTSSKWNLELCAIHQHSTATTFTCSCITITFSGITKSQFQALDACSPQRRMGIRHLHPSSPWPLAWHPPPQAQWMQRFYYDLCQLASIDMQTHPCLRSGSGGDGAPLPPGVLQRIRHLTSPLSPHLSPLSSP